MSEVKDALTAAGIPERRSNTALILAGIALAGIVGYFAYKQFMKPKPTPAPPASAPTPAAVEKVSVETPARETPPVAPSPVEVANQLMASTAVKATAPAPLVTPSATEAPRPATSEAEVNLATGQMLMAFARDVSACPSSMAGKATHNIGEAKKGDEGGIAFYDDQMACLKAKGWAFDYDRADQYGVKYYVVSRT